MDLSQGERLLRAQKLMEAIADCEWEDAELVMSMIMHEGRAGWPNPPFVEIDDEAEFWARMATYDELLAYFIECGKRLVHRKIGQRGRIRMVRRMLEDMPIAAVQDLIVDVFSGRVGQEDRSNPTDRQNS